MNKCPKCETALPEESHFCMHCFALIGNEQNSLITVKKPSAWKSFLLSKAFKTVVLSVLAVSLVCAMGIVIKRFVNPVKMIDTHDIAIVPVTDSYGETVTNKNGEAVTQTVVEITDNNGEPVTNEDGSKIYQAIVSVTNENGEVVTNDSGEIVYEVSTYTQSDTDSISTTKKGLFDFLFNKNKNSTEPYANSSANEPETSAQVNNSKTTEASHQTNASDTSVTLSSSTKATETQPTNLTTKENPTTQPTTQGKTSVSDFSYTETDGIITITKYNGNDSYVTVPAYIDGKPVKHVGEDAFANNSNIQTIFFESGNHYFQLFEFKTVFKNLPNLNEIIFPKNTSNLTLTDSGNEYESFYFYKMIENCNNISGIYFGSKDNSSTSGLYSKDGVVYSRGYILVYYPPAKKDTFYALNTYCTRIEGAAFKNNPYLKHLQISRDLKFINTGHNGKQYNFLGCTALEKFSVADGNTHYSAKDGVLYYRPDGTMNGITYYSFHYPPAKKGDYFETIDQPVIISHGFYGNPYIETIKLSNAYFQDVTQLRGNASSPVNLKKIIIKAEPHWSYTQKLKEYGIEYEIAS